MTVVAWGWIYLAGFVGLMFYFGYVGMRRTHSADSYATARGSYIGPVLGLSYMAMIASGATFMGVPGIAYESGFKGAYVALLYPIGAYIGTMLIARRLKRSGDRLGSATIPDFLGDLYRSPVVRAVAALMSLFLIYYLMAQLAASGQLFETLMGIPYQYGLLVVIGILMVYMTIGGSHSDIITDAVQGFFMLVIAGIVAGAFFVGFGVDGFGPGAVNAALPEVMRWDVHTDPANPSFANWWMIIAVLVSHLGFIALPHLGNKFFALRGTAQVRQFVVTSSLAGFVVSFLFLGGILARAIGVEPDHPDAVVPTLFIEMLPSWMAALLSIAILSAILSTSDGLLMSISQIFANDLYRKTWVPWRGQDPKDPRVDRRSLLVGRIGVLLAGFVAAAAVWTPPELLVIWMWLGLGGIISALTGPVFLGVWWRGANTAGALGGALTGFLVYLAVHMGPQFGLYAGWYPLSDNPFASTVVGMAAGFLGCWLWSRIGAPLPEQHMAMVRSAETVAERGGEQAW
ncbi:sodium:solute symporter family protein [Allosalinactinospora lopnorensis]|uniref:sodium:solute symporter family protein n=1 Tax=Allosalinactinospora lopnorensis TaxID=1352348 RepID=UPI000623F82C|nr:sodium:solute symporter family protein [Allosalinactinospora lopnorensis]